jgi:hypothetical protein
MAYRLSRVDDDELKISDFFNVEAAPLMSF